MKKISKKIVMIAITVVVLICAYVVILMISNAQWSKGLYLFENSIQIYTDDGNVEFDINAIVVGNNILEIVESENLKCYLKNGENTTEVEITALNINKVNHYYDVDFTISCNLSEGYYLFDDLIVHELDGENSWSVSGDIEITVEPKAREPQIEKFLTAYRDNEMCEFIYTISNPTKDDIIISEMNGNIQAVNLFLINDDALDNDIMEFANAKKFSFPVTVPANKQAHFYYRIPLNERLNDTYLYISPSIDYKVSGSDEIGKLYFKLNSNPPTIPKTINDILNYINEVSVNK